MPAPVIATEAIAGVALWTLASDTPWSSTVHGPAFADVFARVQARVKEGWALDPAFAPFIQRGKLFGNFLTLSAVFNVTVPPDSYQAVSLWSREYLKTPLHKLTLEVAYLRNQIKTIRQQVRVELAKKEMGYGGVEDEVLTRSTKLIARLREIDTLLHVKYLPAHNVPLPKVPDHA